MRRPHWHRHTWNSLHQRWRRKPDPQSPHALKLASSTVPQNNQYPTWVRTPIKIHHSSWLQKFEHQENSYPWYGWNSDSLCRWHRSWVTAVNHWCDIWRWWSSTSRYQHLTVCLWVFESSKRVVLNCGVHCKPLVLCRLSFELFRPREWILWVQTILRFLFLDIRKCVYQGFKNIQELRVEGFGHCR